MGSVGQDEKRIKEETARGQKAEPLLAKEQDLPSPVWRDDETPEAQERLEFWQCINNKDVSDGWRDDESIREVISDVRERLGGRRCRWKDFTEAEFDEVLRCTASWKACGVDSVYSFPIKKCPPIKKAVFQLVKRLVEWKTTDRWDEENNWLLEGRTDLIFKGGDRKDPSNYRPITCLPTITMVTLAIHKRMRSWLFGSVESSILDCEQMVSEPPRDARRPSSRTSPRM